MNKRVLGKTNIKVSELAFGGVEIGMPYGIGVKEHQDMISEKDAVILLNNALDKGVNFFDTARLYGESERIMGIAFSGKRDRTILCTKCKHFKGVDGEIPELQLLRKIVDGSLNESLASLKTDYVDVFMVHYADQLTLQNEEVARIFSDLKKSGRVRAIGVSVYEPEETAAALKAGVWDVIQLPFNLMDQRQGQFFDEAASLGVGIVIRSVLMRGFLSNRGIDMHPALAAVEQHIYSYKRLMDTGVDDLPGLATKFALSFEAVSAVLVGIDKQIYLDEALATVNGKYLTKDILEMAMTMSYPEQEFLNLAQWDKNGWL